MCVGGSCWGRRVKAAGTNSTNCPSSAQRDGAGQAARVRLVGGVSEDYEALFKLKTSVLLARRGAGGSVPGFDSGPSKPEAHVECWSRRGGPRGPSAWPRAQQEARPRTLAAGERASGKHHLLRPIRAQRPNKAAVSTARPGLSPAKWGGASRLLLAPSRGLPYGLGEGARLLPSQDTFTICNSQEVG